MDWVSVAIGFVSGLIGQAPAWFMLARQQRKMDAETAKTDAETATVWSGLFEDLIKSLKEDNGRLIEERDLARERARNLQTEVEILYEQKMAAIGHNTILTARLAMREGDDVGQE